MTGATAISSNNNRIKNLVGGYKTINGVVYIDLEFDFNFTTSGQVFDMWRLTTSTFTIDGKSILIDHVEGRGIVKDWGYILDVSGRLNAVIFGTYTMSNLGHQHVRVKIY